MTSIVTAPPPTEQQQTIYDAVRSGTGHVLVEALAGTGKTTTCCQAAALADGKVGFVAFNKTIADELKARLNGAAKACTLHSLGLAALKRAFPESQLDEGKAKRLLQKLRPDWFWQSKRGVRMNGDAQAVLSLAGWCKKTLTPEADTAAMDRMVDYYGVELSDQSPARHAEAGHPLYRAAAELLAACGEETAAHDFDDMVWLPPRLGLRVEQFDLLMVDEAQDLSPCQRALAAAACRSGRLMPVGDRNQSIYGFTGADPESIPSLAADLAGSPRGCLRLPLTVTWRCPRLHVRLANELVPDLQAAPGAIEGEVGTIAEDETAAHVQREMKPGDMVLSRRNAPLVALAFQLMARGVPALVRGRDIGKGLLDLLDGFTHVKTPYDLCQELVTYQAAETERLDRKDAPESAYQSLNDRVGCLKELSSRSGSLNRLKETIKTLFADCGEAGKVVLSSIHRAKGLEADQVLIIDTKNLPLVLSCRECNGRGRGDGASKCPKCLGRGTRQKPWEVQQESNLLYVAVTRSKRVLTFAGPVPALLGGDWS